jgi:hypothetical protein
MEEPGLLFIDIQSIQVVDSAANLIRFKGMAGTMILLGSGVG